MMMTASGVARLGSFGPNEWLKCFWCDYWQRGNMARLPGGPLCNQCFDWHVGQGGGPYRPDAIDRAENHLAFVLRPIIVRLTLPEEPVRLLAEFLRSRWQP